MADELAEKYKDDCKEFRRSLLDSHVLDVVAIHFCRWDGSPRKSIAEIRDAVCLYPSSPKKMIPLLKLFLKVALGAAVVGGVYTVGFAGGVQTMKDKIAERFVAYFRACNHTSIMNGFWKKLLRVIIPGRAIPSSKRCSRSSGLPRCFLKE